MSSHQLKRQWFLPHDRIVWWMTSDESGSRVAYVSWVARGPEAIGHMGNMLFSMLSTRASAMTFRRCSDWSEMSLPYLRLVVDEGIDIGDLADAINKRGGVVGVSLVVRERSEDE